MEEYELKDKKSPPGMQALALIKHIMMEFAKGL
jgi:hypothetical protein